MTGGAAAIRIALLTCAACGGAWHPVPTLGAQVDAPAGARVEESDGHAFVGDGRFRLNLFAVDELSPASADAQRQRLERAPGFVRITHAEPGERTWRFDYELEGGLAGTVARIQVARPLDCGVHGVAPDVAAQVAASCARVRAP